MKLFRVVGCDELYVSRSGMFYSNEDNICEKIIIPPQLKTFFARLVLNTFVGPLNGKIIFKDNDKSNIELSNLEYKLNVFKLNEEIIVINGEEFKRINDFDNYFISQNGVVYSIKLNKLLKVKINKFQYYTIGITNNNGVRKFVMIHRKVYETWVGKIPCGKEINHKNSKPWINSLYNLEIVTPIQNIAYSIKFNNRYSKWNKKIVESICDMIKDGYHPNEIYKSLNLSDMIQLKDFRVFCNHLKNKTKFWVEISSKYDFSNAYKRKTKYSNNLIKEVTKMIKDGFKQNEIANRLNIDFRVVSAIKTGKIKESDARSTTRES